jgi:hypothetical protein
MPSGEHESPVALARMDPGLVAWLLGNLFDVKVPDYDHARPHATDVRVIVPRTYHSDSMVLFCDAADRPLLATVFEVQRRWDLGKRRTWKLYVAQLAAELDVDTALLAYCPDPSVASRYRTLFATDEPFLCLRPLIFTPEDVPLVVDVDAARASPALAVLSAICHGDHAEVEAAFPALMEALRAAGPSKAVLYYDVVLAGLPLATRTRWEAFMTIAADYQFQSELLRNAQAQGKAEGKAEGAALAILTVLDGRGVAVPDEVRDQVLGCADTSQLGIWLRRASTATTVEDVIGE